MPLAHAAGGSGSNLDLFSEPQTPAVPQLKFEQVCKILKPLFTSKSILKIGHNIKFDLHFMEQVWGEETLVEPLEDTAVLSYVLNGTEHGHGLDELAKLYLDHKMIAYEEVCGSGKIKSPLTG